MIEPELTLMARLWNEDLDTHQIANTLHVTEAWVYNRLDLIKRTAALLRYQRLHELLDD
jgi:predicted DNA-binding protein YlxM (UPF0122 family)